MESETMPITMPLCNIGDIFNLPSSMELLRDEDFEKAMMLLDCPDFQKEDITNSDQYMVGLADTFNSQATKSTFNRNEQQSATGEFNLPYGAHSCLSPDLKIQISDRRPVICDQHIKRECDVSGYSPVMESFLREHWDDIVGTGSRPVWPLKASSSCSSPLPPKVKNHYFLIVSRHLQAIIQ
ncbi:hypothetical protein CCR75_004493 [Bremia lactucae]|uniref:Uncharacterized protein n=1 Tax=Bremia lactucae TaxID=4779 RepID=A0A976IDU1_BRELC|nr:hypothetical protein CCR75_004493 [Bremia lactucae]